jgi:RNA polymerase sigma-70 factor (ECF subfamily)
MSAGTLNVATLYKAELGRLRAFGRRIVGNQATAEDLVQQAFANLLSRSGQKMPVNPAYITQAVRNLALNHLRDTRRRANVELSGAELERIADERPSPEMEAIHRNELRNLLEAVAGLPARRRQAFVLNKISGLSYDEIAARMAISRNTVISQVVIAMADLDRRLKRN